MKQSTLIIIGVLAAIVGALTSKKLFNVEDQIVSRSPLEAIASSLNTKAPMQIDKNTRWDSTSALPNNVLAYYYTITGVDASNLDKAALQSQLTTIVTASYKTFPDMQGLRDLKANLKYVYKTEDGAHLFDIEVPYTSIAP